MCPLIERIGFNLTEAPFNRRIHCQTYPLIEKGGRKTKRRLNHAAAIVSMIEEEEEEEEEETI